MTDMTKDVFAETKFGRAALKQLAPVPENFRLYEAEWLGKTPKEFRVMRVRGAEFRAAKSGPNKGRLTVLIKGTVRDVYVTKEEMQEVKG